MLTMKAQVAPMFCALHTPFHILFPLHLRSLARDTDINCMSNPVHVHIALCQTLLQTLRFPWQSHVLAS
jgi:hypothetical protein